jgi:23S rRNA (cytosine1962-C5)-methyltransferase
LFWNEGFIPDRGGIDLLTAEACQTNKRGLGYRSPVVQPSSFEHHNLLATEWKDYELLQCGNGLKRERWGEVRLIRPDPQIIWPLEEPWGRHDAIYHRSEDGGGQWKFKRQLPEHWQITFAGLQFKIRPTNFKHTGLFPEQASNWTWVMKKIGGAGRPIRVLNLFGYTGAATVAAVAAGASVCHVDAAKGMVQWCGENVKLSGLGEKPIRYIVDDCVKFVQREIRRGQQYDAIIMDPPSFGRGAEGQVWKLERDLWPLLESCHKILSGQPLFFLLNSYTTGLSPTILTSLLFQLMKSASGNCYGGELALPITGDSRVLPCGIYARWEAV